MTTQASSYTETIAKPPGMDAPPPRPVGPEEGGQDRDELRAIFNVPVNVQVVLGRTTMPVSQLLKLGRGAVVELNRKVGEAVDVFVNDRLIARGEVVIVDDGRLGVTMTEIVKAELSQL